MADSSVDITPGSGKTVSTRTNASSEEMQVMMLGIDGDNAIVPTTAANGLLVDVSRVQGSVTLGTGANTIGALTANQSTNISQMNGVTVTMGNGVSGTGVQRVTLASDSTGQVALAAGAATIGALTANQSVNVAQVNGVATTMGNGVSGTGVQRVTLASDSTGQVALATGANTIGALTANQSVNLNQIAGTAASVGQGSSDNGTLRVAAADRTSLGQSLSMTNTANAITLTGLSGVSDAMLFVVYGTGTGTIIFEGSSDTGTTWYSIPGIAMGAAPTGVLVNTATASGQWVVPTAGLNQVRVRCSVTGTNSVTVSIICSNGSSTTSLWAPLPVGTNVIGALSANQSVNVAQINGVTATMGNGVSGTGVMRVTIASDSTGQVALAAGASLVGKVGIDQTTVGTTNAVSLAQLGANTVATGNGVSSTGTLRVSVASDSTGQIALATGANTIGALTANQSTNIAQMNGVTVTMGNGVSGTGVQRVTLASDSTGQVALATGANTIGALTANQSTNIAQMNGVATTMGNGVSGTGVQRVTLASDSTGVVSLATGANTIGALTANQSVNVAQINGVAATMGNGVSGTGVQRVTLASDSTGQVALATGANTIGALTANQSVNMAQIAGTTSSVGQGSSDTGTMRVAVSDRTSITQALSMTSTANAVTLTGLSGAASATLFAAYGTGTGTIIFEGSTDTGTTWYSIPAIAMGASPTGVLVNTATASGQWVVPAGGLNQIRVRCSVTGVNSVNVSIICTNGSMSTGLWSPLPAGSNIIGALTANQSVNVAQINGVTATMGNGVSGTGVQRVTIASDSTGQVALATGANTIGALTANQSVNVAQINGVTATMGNGVSGTGVQRVTLASDSTGQVVLATGANTIGALTANQSTNIAQMNGVATTMGNGVSGTGVQRVTLASDSTGVVSLATGANTIGALTANQSVNVAQVNGVATTMGNGVSGTGVQRVTLASDSTGQVALATGANTIGALTANQSVNLNQIAGTAASVGQGSSDNGTLRVAPADRTSITQALSMTSTANAVTLTGLSGVADAVLFAAYGSGTGTIIFEGSSDTGTTWYSIPGIAQGASPTGVIVNTATASGQWVVPTAGLNQIRVRCSVTGVNSVNVSIICSNGASTVALWAPIPVGSNIIGALTANQTVNVAQVNGVATTMGNGVSGTGVQRVTIASDSTGQVALATGANTIGALTANQSVNVAQINGVAATMGNGVSGTGVQRVTLASDSTGQVVALGAAAHNAALSGAPNRIGGRGVSADISAVTTGNTTDLIATLLGKMVTYPWAIPGNSWSYAAAAGGLVNTSGVTAKTAAGAGIRVYIQSVQAINSHATIGSDVQIRDGASGTVLWRGYAQFGGGGCAARFDPPLRGTANTLVEVAEGTATATNGVFVNLSGFVAAE